MKTNIRHLIDFAKVDTLLEGFNKSTGFVTAILDLEGNVLSKSGWRTFCTEFHRLNPETSKRCTISDTVLANKMGKGDKYHAYKCLNGLMDVVVPLNIRGEHVANLFSGQFFFEKPDVAFFKKQANEFGFDETKYLEALSNVPVVSEEKVKTVMDFLLNMTELISDLTIQKLEQAELNQNFRNSEQSFKSVFESANVGKSITLPSGEINVNDAFCEMLGYSRVELEKKKWQDITPEEDIPSIQKTLDNLMLGEKKSARFEKRYLCKNGSYIWADVSVSMLRDKNGQPLHFITTAIDITERKRTDEALRLSENRLNRALENIPDVVVIYDKNLKIQYINAATSKISGRPVSDFIGKQEEEIWPPEVYQVYLPLLQESLETGKVRSMDTELTFPNGDIRSLGITCVPLLDEDGAVREVMGVTNDFTDRKMAEKALRESEEKFFTLFEKSPFAVTLSKLPDGTFIAVNEAFEREFGFTKHEALGKNSSNLGINPDSEGRKRILEALKESNSVRNQEMVLHSKSGEKHYYETNIDKVVINGEEYLLNTTQNINEYKRAENKLKENYNLIRIAGEKAKLGGWNVILKENRLYWSDEVAAIHEMPAGYAPLVEDGINFYAPEWHKKITEVFSKCVQQGIPYDEEMEIITATGKRVWVRTIGEAVRDGNGNIYKIQGAFQDITLKKQAEEELQKSKNNLEEYFENDISANYVVSVSGEILNCNKTFLNLFGFENKSDSQGFDITKLFMNPNYRQQMHSLIRKHGKVENHEVKFISRERKTIYALINALGIFDKDNTLEKIRGYVVDITEQKKAQIALRQSEALYREFFESDITGDYVATSEGVILDCNPAFTKILGYDKAEEVIGSNISEMYQNADKRKDFLRLIQNKKILKDYTSRLKRKDGAAIVCNENIVGKFDANGNLVQYFGYMYDITEKIQAEEKLIIHEQLLSSVMDTQQELICRFLPDTTLVFVNKAYCKLFGKNEQELLGHKFLEMVPESGWEDIFSYLKRLNNENPQITYKSPAFKADGSVSTIEWTDIAIFNEEGEVAEFQSVGRDITEKLKTLNELIIAKEKAEESDRLKSAFLANMSHEIRTPMNGILGFTDLLLNPDLSSEKKENYIKIVHQSGQRMLNTVTDIVEISKIEAGMVNVSEEEIDLNSSVEELICFFEPEAEKKELKLKVDNLLPITFNNITTDPNKFVSILTNLIKNAIKYTESGTINVGCRTKGNVVEFYVKDTGIGIPTDRHDAIFERFVQSDIADTNAFEGSGLGLAIAKSYVEMLGGNIWVESHEGIGSTFYFTLPVNNNRKEKLPSHNEISDDTVRVYLEGKKLKTLIAEDDETSRNYISLVINEFSSEILEAGTGIEAIELCRKHNDIDFILMDVKMPDMDGYEATRRIREFNKEVFIIAQTAYGLAGDREKAIESGCNDYIAKPVNKNELHAMTQKYFAK